MPGWALDGARAGSRDGEHEAHPDDAAGQGIPRPVWISRGEGRTETVAQPVLASRDLEVRAPFRIAVHDCDLVINGLRVMFEPHVDRLQLAQKDRPHAADLLLIDPFARDAGACLDLYRTYEAPIVLFTWLEGDRLDTWTDAPGVRGHLLKTAPAEELVSALEALALTGSGALPYEGENIGDDLSQREREILHLIAAGLTNQEIADKLHVSINTVKTYVRGAYRKIGADRRSQAVGWVLSNSN